MAIPVLTTSSRVVSGPAFQIRMKTDPVIGATGGVVISLALAANSPATIRHSASDPGDCDSADGCYSRWRPVAPGGRISGGSDWFERFTCVLDSGAAQ